MLAKAIASFMLSSALLLTVSARPVADLKARQATSTTITSTVVTQTYLIPTTFVSGQVLAQGLTWVINGASTVIAAPTTLASTLVAQQPVPRVETLISTIGVAPGAPTEQNRFLCKEGQLYQCNALGNGNNACPPSAMTKLGCPAGQKCVEPVCGNATVCTRDTDFRFCSMS